MGWVLFFLSAFLCTERSNFRIRQPLPLQKSAPKFLVLSALLFQTGGGAGDSYLHWLMVHLANRDKAGRPRRVCARQALAHEVLPARLLSVLYPVLGGLLPGMYFY